MMVVASRGTDGADAVRSPIMEDEIGSFLRADPGVIAWPYPMYDRWRANHPIYRYQGGPGIVLTRHWDVKRVMSDGVHISNNGYRHGTLAEGVLSVLPEADHDLFYEVMDFESSYVSRTDGEQHDRLRRIAGRAFTRRRMQLLRDSIADHVDRLVEALRDQEAPDIKQGLANQLPIRVVTDLIGVPASDREMIWGWSEAIAKHFSLDPATLHSVHDAIANFKSYVHDVVMQPGLSSRTELAAMLLGGSDGEALSEEELVAMFVLLLFAGSETTTNLLGNGFLALQRHRDQWDLICNDPSLVRDAVEECLRYDAPLQYLPRVVVDDLEIDGHPVCAGETVIIFIGAANRDPERFTDPSTFDLARPNKNEHLALAFGPHFCLGASLARLEGEMVFGTLARRFPDARLVTDAVPYGGSAMLRSIQSLPTDLGRERR